jgi:hypothetical protein
MVRALVSSPLAEWMHQLHPVELPYEVFSDANPMMAPMANMAEEVRENRRPVAADNPFVDMQETVSRQIVAGLNAWRDMTEALAERRFLAVYGSPVMQAAVGIDPGDCAKPSSGRSSMWPSRGARSMSAALKLCAAFGARTATCPCWSSKRSYASNS